MVGVPPARVVTKPVAEPTPAAVLLLLAHTPPPEPSLNVAVSPAQKTAVPDMRPGSTFTVIALAIWQPEEATV
jgi:hypothetical protein